MYDVAKLLPVRDHKQITSCLKVAICSYFYAPEWTRTTTPLTQDKALNLIQRA
jgi:hypothetical protein